MAGSGWDFGSGSLGFEWAPRDLRARPGHAYGF
jgi:hypothetical protein